METTLSTVDTPNNCYNNTHKRNGKTNRNKSSKSKRKPKHFFSAIQNLEELVESFDNYGVNCLREQLVVLMNEKETLSSCNQQKDHEISQLKRNLNELNDIINSTHIDLVGRGSDLFSNKIIELSKKNRQLFSEMESYKTKCSQMEVEISKLNQALEEKPKEDEKVPLYEDPSELEILRDRLYSTKQKLFATMNENSNLKNELKVAIKCLQQELGIPVVNLQNIAATCSNWRGRAQQILTLQRKVTELSKKIDGTDSDDTKQQNRLEFVRRCEIEGLQKECCALKETIDKLEFKLSATKARNKNLNDEATSYKLKSEDLLKKCKALDDYINALHVSNHFIRMLLY